MTNAERIKQMSDKDLAIFIMCPAEYDVAFTKSCGCNGEMNKTVINAHWNGYGRKVRDDMAEKRIEKSEKECG